ncbi:MAG TPA: hypothetical protein VFA72_23855 [Burkholderiales bacterium]|nr:hypothetical protein [Burkholderiales bacterium]
MRLAFVLAATLIAGGCASTTENADNTPVSAGMRDVDQAKMQQVEDVAARRGVRIQWVNPPRKPEQPAGG